MLSTLKDIIINISSFNDEGLVFVKKTDGKFTSISEAVVVDLSGGEVELKTFEISELKCPGFEYFLDVFIIKDMINDFKSTSNAVDLNKRVERIIDYAEYDA